MKHEWTTAGMFGLVLAVVGFGFSANQSKLDALLTRMQFAEQAAGQAAARTEQLQVEQVNLTRQVEEITMKLGGEKRPWRPRASESGEPATPTGSSSQP